MEYEASPDGTYCIVTGIGTATDTNIVIPSEYNGMPVKEIRKRAFYLCSSLTSMTIPGSVTSIGDYAFSYCNSLETIYYTGSEEQWNESVGDNSYDLEDVTIIFNYEG